MLTPEIEKKIEALRASVTSRLGEFRANHVLSTEGEAARIASVYLPDDEEKVRISALLHDITKEYTKEHLDKSDNVPEFDVFVVWSCKTLQNNKALLSTSLPDGMYYEVTYNGDKKEMYFDAYKKLENKCIKIESEDK